MNSFRSTCAMVVLAWFTGGLTVPACGGGRSGGPGSDSAISGDAQVGRDGRGDGAGATGAGASGGGGATGGGDSGTSSDAAPGPVPISCQTAAPQCNDGNDNDADGKMDSLDPECVGPCDNDEGSFATGIAGDNIDACKQDCFFDGNSGMGDDGCEWNLKCDSASPGGASCPYDATFRNCPKQQSPKCVSNCQKLTPNGCDCFGCCAVTAAGQPVSVMLTASCTADKFGDAAACPRCTQNTACLNTCGKCEVCVGRPAPDPSCNMSTGVPDGGGMGGSGGTDGGGTVDGGGGTSSQCAAGVTSCGPGGQVAATACGVGSYCQTGCCIGYTVD